MRNVLVEQGLMPENEFHRISLIAYMCNLDSKNAWKHFSKYLTSDGYELKQIDTTANMPIYSVVPLTPGVNGKLKNIIFASKYKPEIVLSDALNNNVTIVNNADQCLVYDEPRRIKKIPYH